MSLVTFAPTEAMQVTLRPRVYKVDIGKVGFQGAQGIPGPSSDRIISVKDAPYNAVGNGSTDDTAAILSAQGVAGVGGQLLFPGPATYLVTTLAADLLDQNWIIPHGTTIKLKNSTNTTLIDITADGVVIDLDGTLDGNKANQVAGGLPISVASVSDCVIRGAGQIINAEVYGLLGTDCPRLQLRDFTVMDSGDMGVFVHAVAGDIEGLDIWNLTVDRTAVGTGLTHGGIHVRGSDDLTHQLIGPKVMGCRVLLPYSPTAVDDTSICIEVWAERSRIIGNETVGGSMGVSQGFGMNPMIVSNVVRGAKTIGVECADSPDPVVGPNIINGYAEDGVTRLTRFGTVINQCPNFEFNAGTTIGISDGGVLSSAGLHVYSDTDPSFGRIDGGVIDVAGDGKGIWIQAASATADLSGTSVGAITVIGDGTTNGQAIAFDNGGAGTVANVSVSSSCVLNDWAQGISGLGTISGQVQMPTFINCTAKYGGTATTLKHVNIDGNYLDLTTIGMWLRSDMWMIDSAFAERFFLLAGGQSIYKGHGAGISHDFRNTADESLGQLSTAIAAGETAFLVRVDRAGVESVVRVKEGASGTGPGGAGRMLYTD